MHLYTPYLRLFFLAAALAVALAAADFVQARRLRTRTNDRPQSGLPSTSDSGQLTPDRESEYPELDGHQGRAVYAPSEMPTVR